MAKTSTTTATAFEGQTQDAKAALKQVLDDLYGLLDDTTVAFTPTTILAKFPADSFTNAVLLQLVQNGAFVADANTRALFADGIWTAGKLDAKPRRHTAQTLEFNIDIGAGTTQDVVLLRPSTAITITAARIVYSEQTSGVCAAGTMQLGTTVGGAEISAATNLENAKGVGTNTAMAIVAGAVAANTPVIARYTGVAAAVVGTVVAEIEYQVDA